MACKIAENEPLNALRRDLGLKKQCHSARPSCIKGLRRAEGAFAMGAPGAALGYCQALFRSRATARAHTEYVRKCLKEIDAPWAESHELFWGYRRQETASRYLSDAIDPLKGTGRIPILITGLDPGEKRTEIEEILRTLPPISPGETILVRVILSSDDSIASAADLMSRLVARAEKNSAMPNWWPLLQGNVSAQGWRRLKGSLGNQWQYTNIAINPFISGDALETIWDQITVAQIPVGLAEGVQEDGTVSLAAGMKITGAGDCASYDLSNFLNPLAGLHNVPTLIILGPAAANWPDQWNLDRVRKLMPVLRRSVEVLWKDLPQARREMVWNLEA